MKIYLSSKGIKPNIDIAPIINKVIAGAKEKSTLVFPDGNFPIGSTIVHNKKTIHWEGSEDTTLSAMTPITLVNFSGARSVVNRIVFSGYYSIYDKVDTPIDGVQVEGITFMTHCQIKNVWGNGLSITGDLGSRKTDVSHSRFDNLQINECNRHGMFFQGGDANTCGVYNCDIRDCNGVGIKDSSFLGNRFFNCMMHNNKERSVMVDSPSSRASFFGCYAEGGQAACYLGGCSSWFGGHAWIELHNFAYAAYKDDNGIFQPKQ